ncbi:MAG: hypothetical protein HY747_04700 [Elusimicrobia bacterium]|nr:hypothetical protein [Elusimicrobiota bacterium]
MSSRKSRIIRNKSKPCLFFRLLSCLLSWLLIFELVPLNAFAAIDPAGQEEFQPQHIQVSQGILNSNAEEAKSITHAYFDGADLPNVQSSHSNQSSVLPVGVPVVPASTKGPALDELHNACEQAVEITGGSCSGSANAPSSLEQ